MSPAELLDHWLWRNLTLTLLHFVWQGLAIALLLALVVEVLRVRRASSRYACSLAALVAMALCPAATLGWLCQIEPSLSMDIEAQPVVALASDHWAQDWLSAAQACLLPAWLVGVALFGFRLLLGLAGLRQLRRDLLPLPMELAERVARLGRRLRFDPQPLVHLSGRVSEALAVGLVRPIVLIPIAWATEMPLDLLEGVIAHELAHLRRRDLWVNLLQRVLETLLFYHPAVWWLSRRLRAERELCCDEWAVAATGRRLEYVQALEIVARRRVARVQPALGAGIRGEKNMRLLQRVRNVLGQSAGKDRSRLWPAGLAAMALVLGVWTVGAGVFDATGNVAVADDEREDREEPREREEREERDEPRERDREDDRDDRDRGYRELVRERLYSEGDRELHGRKLDDDTEQEGRRVGNRERDDDVRERSNPLDRAPERVRDREDRDDPRPTDFERMRGKAREGAKKGKGKGRRGGYSGDMDGGPGGGMSGMSGMSGMYGGGGMSRRPPPTIRPEMNPLGLRPTDRPPQEGRIDELTELVQRLTMRVERLQHEVAELRGRKPGNQESEMRMPEVYNHPRPEQIEGLMLRAREMAERKGAAVEKQRDAAANAREQAGQRARKMREEIEKVGARREAAERKEGDRSKEGDRKEGDRKEGDRKDENPLERDDQRD
ncbi:MAG: M56 family metallopeptidase [Pirellulaceae bacterium]